MALFKTKTAEEKAEERKRESEQAFRSEAIYLAEKTGIDYKDIVREYEGAPDGLTARYNSVSGARELRAWSVAGLVVCGIFAAVGTVNTILTGTPENVPYISTALTILSAIGLRASNRSIHRAENALREQVQAEKGPAAPTPGAPA